MTITYLLGDTHEHPLYQTHRLRSRSSGERPDHGRSRISVRASGAPESDGAFSRPATCDASMVDLKVFENAMRGGIHLAATGNPRFRVLRVGALYPRHSGFGRGRRSYSTAVTPTWPCENCGLRNHVTVSFAVA